MEYNATIEFNIYPYQIIVVLNIEHNGISIKEVALFNLLNQKVYSSKTDVTAYNINELNSGTYILHINTKENKVYKQLIHLA